MDVIFKPELVMSQLKFITTEELKSEPYTSSESKDEEQSEEESYEAENHETDNPSPIPKFEPRQSKNAREVDFHDFK
jgi:hypothetical protein